MTPLGVGSHTDTNFLTIILQDGCSSTGLQVYTAGANEWIDVPTVEPDCFICNLGEQAEILSGGYFLATPHRVLLSNHNRISVPFFYNPSLEAVGKPLIEPEESSLPWERDDSKAKAWRMSNSSNSMLSSVGENTFKSLARSHPAVLERHHPDLKVLPSGQVVLRT